MSTGSLALALALLATAAPPSDVIPMNTRAFKIPIQIGEGQRDKIRELILFVSSDQGITWNETAQVKPDQDAFKFYAPTDGLYWFNICMVDTQGKRQPPDIFKTPPRQKILVDTQKPTVHIVSAERQGDDVAVKWDIQEDHPELTSLKLEYRTPDAPAWMWYSAPLTPGLSGQTSFKFNNSGPVTLRLQMLDSAGNVGMDQKDLPAKATSVIATAPVTPATIQTNPTAAAPTGTQTSLTAAPAFNAQAGPAIGSSTVAAPDMAVSAAPVSSPTPPAPSIPAPQLPSPTRSMPASNWEQSMPVQQTALNQVEQRPAPERSWGPPPGVGNNVQIGSFSSSFQQTTSRWPGAPNVPLQITNNPQVTLEYEVTKVGHSGVGRVALYLTKDEGRTWELYGEDPDLKPPMTVSLPGEGLYGLRLVITSRAGLGGKPPQPGDLPQMRIEVDTTPPAVKLFYPQPAPNRRDALILTWSATDHSLAPNPITLQWAERPDGAWQTVATDLGNTGRYIWQPAANMPYRVFIRVLARDTAGNIAVDESPEPVLIDLLEPEGQLTGISPMIRRP